MTAAAPSQITFGIAGVIYPLRSSQTPLDDAWLAEAFRNTPSSVRTTWRSPANDVVMVSCLHASEAGPSPAMAVLPAAGELTGLVAGHFFGARHSATPMIASRRLLDDYAASGISSLRRVNGSWVAILWDRQRQVALLARDTVGTRPLYAVQLPDRIVFSTDLRFFRLRGLLTELDEQGAAEFLHYLYVPPPRTILKNCHAVMAGHALSIGETMSNVRYAEPRFTPGPLLPAADVAAEIEAQVPAFEERLLRAVSECLPPSGRIALSLSGGKDSATLAVALAKLCPDRVLAFTVGAPGEATSEAEDGARVCRALGLEHASYSPEPEEVPGQLQRFLREHDQPIGDPAAFAYFHGMSCLPDDCTAVMDGAGNDDYFGVTGHSLAIRYRTRLAVQSRVPAWAWPLLVRVMAHGTHATRSLSRYWAKPIEESFVSWDGWTVGDLSRLLRREVSFADTHLWQLMRSVRPDDWKLLLTEVMGRIWEPETGFAKGTHFAQALGLAMRYPYIDTRLEQWVHALPSELKLDKALLRAFMRRHLPREIVEKPKSGFLFDLNRLLAHPGYRWPAMLASTGAFQPMPSWSTVPVRELLDAYAAAPQEERWQQRLYALCLLAEVAGAPTGRHANANRSEQVAGAGMAGRGVM